MRDFFTIVIASYRSTGLPFHRQHDRSAHKLVGRGDMIKGAVITSTRGCDHMMAWVLLVVVMVVYSSHEMRADGGIR